MYVYIESEKGLWTTGFFKPGGEWVPESDHNSKEEAATRVVYLNGGGEDTFQEDVEVILRQHGLIQ